VPKFKNHLSQSEVRHLFDYREDGALINRFTRGPRSVKGRVAGNQNSNGYWRVAISGVTYRLSRLIWTWHYGDISYEMEVDHIDRNPCNARELWNKYLTHDVRRIIFFNQSTVKSIQRYESTVHNSENQEGEIIKCS
jgi:hypothetical protein